MRHGHSATNHYRKHSPRQRRHLRKGSSYPRTCLAASQTDRFGYVARNASRKISVDPRGTALVASQVA
ncbi:hypothetical protein [Sphingobium sp.]|uniref:hypothetical protein n=1 Tax=Sphingobium sp. TaxID=1912891 RepID=UPI002C8383C8|nr:hypothetical protein [Sphingobium sp.]HUD92894.1 hypothetical protein [Sphingobium sp.]